MISGEHLIKKFGTASSSGTASGEPGLNRSCAKLSETESMINARFDRIISLIILFDITLRPFLKDN